jgi:HPt (histidine-containing phosphotransfer) domain-containing protein
MAYDPGTMDIALSAVVGADAALMNELRGAFIESAERQIRLLGRSRCDANWIMAALRLKGLCASFGVQDLLDLAEEAVNSAPGDPAIQRRLMIALDAIRTRH